MSCRIGADDARVKPPPQPAPLHARLLDPPVCRDLLRTGAAGHLGVSKGALPIVVPVGYTIEDAHLWVFAGPGLDHPAPWRHEVVALHAGAAEPDGRWLWSVVVQGRAENVATGEPAPGTPRPDGTPVPPSRCLRLSMDVVTGWQFGSFDAHRYLSQLG